jgi:hypothetical protein
MMGRLTAQAISLRRNNISGISGSRQARYFCFGEPVFAQDFRCVLPGGAAGGGFRVARRASRSGSPGTAWPRRSDDRASARIRSRPDADRPAGPPDCLFGEDGPG